MNNPFLIIGAAANTGKTKILEVLAGIFDGPFRKYLVFRFSNTKQGATGFQSHNLYRVGFINDCCIRTGDGSQMKAWLEGDKARYLSF